jgi:CheY-like chemotaxis protein
VRDVASHILKAVGFDVITAHNGSSGLDTYMTNSDIDLVFSDVIMPGGMTGVELALNWQLRFLKFHLSYQFCWQRAMQRKN